MTLGDFVMYIFFTGLVATPLIQIASIGTQISEAFAGLDRIREIRSMATEDEEDATRLRATDLKGHFVFEDVSFEYDKGVEVLSVHVINTLEGKALWVDFVNEHGMYDWINCWSPYSNEFRTLYNLQAYPALFVFDREKKIVAKRVTPRQAEQIINNLSALEGLNNTTAHGSKTH
jgi:ABC-type multidrug transport system fused ATPase/permease subunit